MRMASVGKCWWRVWRRSLVVVSISWVAPYSLVVCS